MIFHVYSVHDRLTGFLTPTVDQSDPIAMRNFEMAVSVSKDSSLMSFRPSDYSLFRIADFDTESGKLIPVFPPEYICSGDSFVED